MNRFLLATLIAAGVMGVSPVFAQPCVDVDLAFDPLSGTTLDRVTLSGRIANTGDEAGLATVAVTVGFNGESFGPLEANVYLLAGKELGGEIPFLIRPVFPDGVLSITIETSMAECSDAVTASLEVQGTDDSVPSESPDLTVLASSLIHALSQQPTPVQPTTWGKIKSFYQ